MSSIAATYIGSIAIKSKTIFLSTMLVSPFVILFGKITNWAICNSTYVLFVLGAIAVDHFLGTLVHAFKLRDFSIKKNIIGLMLKLGMVVAVGFLFEGIAMLINSTSIVLTYLITTMRLFVFLYPAFSAMENSSILTNGKFPQKGILDKFKHFQENANVKELSKNA